MTTTPPESESRRIERQALLDRMFRCVIEHTRLCYQKKHWLEDWKTKVTANQQKLDQALKAIDELDRGPGPLFDGEAQLPAPGPDADAKEKP